MVNGAGLPDSTEPVLSEVEGFHPGYKAEVAWMERSAIQEGMVNGAGLPDSTAFHPGYRLVVIQTFSNMSNRWNLDYPCPGRA